MAPTDEQVRGPMGLAKIDHLRALLAIPELSDQWRRTHDRAWDESDVERIYRDDYIPLQMETVGNHDRLVPGLLGVVEALRGRGLRLATTTGYSAAAQDVVDQAVAYAKERKQFGKPIGDFQAIAHMLADMQTEVEASRLLLWSAARQLASGKDALKALSMAKLFGSETYVKVSNAGMQIMGGYGYMMEFDMQRHFRESRSTTIAAGTSQMQRNIIAKLMGLNPK